MERQVPLHPCGSKHGIAGAWRYPGFRLHTGGDDPRASRNSERQHALIRKEDITFETAAFVLGAHQIHESRNLDMLIARNEGPHRDDIVKLKMRVRIDSDPPLKRG